MKREPTSTDVKHVTDLIYQFKPETEGETVARVWRAYEGFEPDSPPEDLASPAALDDIGARLERAARAYRACALRAREAFGVNAGIPDAPFAALRYLDPPMPSDPEAVIAMTTARNAREDQRTPPPPPVRVRCKVRSSSQQQCIFDEGHGAGHGDDAGPFPPQPRCPVMTRSDGIDYQCELHPNHGGPHGFKTSEGMQELPIVALVDFASHPNEDATIVDDVKRVARRGLSELLKRLA